MESKDVHGGIQIQSVEEEIEVRKSRRKVFASARIDPEINEFLENVARIVGVSKYKLLSVMIEYEVIRSALLVYSSEAIFKDLRKEVEKLRRDVEELRTMIARLFGKVVEMKMACERGAEE